jgi:pimeloyl-ACP methyl ester carboxylesterase
VAGSNGCSAAARLALDRPDLVNRLVLCWAATCGDPVADALARKALAAIGVEDDLVDALLAGGTLRGVGDDQLASLGPGVSIVPSEPPNVFHQQQTVDALAALVPHSAVEIGFPEAPSPVFAARRDVYIATLVAALTRQSRGQRLVERSVNGGG